MKIQKPSAAKLKPKKKQKKKDILQECSGKQCLAFDFGSYSTKLAVGKLTKNGAEINNMLLLENPEGCNASDPKCSASVVKHLKDALSSNGINTKGNIAMCTLDASAYIRREIELPYIDDAEDLNGAVAYSMSEILSLDVDAYYFSHTPVKRFNNGEAEMCTVMAAALEKKLCENYYSIFKDLGLYPLLMDVNTNGMERYLSAMNSSDETTVCIDYGFIKTDIDIFENSRFVQTFAIEWGESDLTMLLRKIFANKDEVDLESSFSVNPELVYKALVSETDDANVSELKSRVILWSKNIADSLKLYQLNHPSQKISKIILRGGTNQFAWIRPYLEHSLKIKTIIAEKPTDIHIIGKAKNNIDRIPLFLNVLNLFSVR